MAAPITHIVLAEKVYQRYFSGKDKKKFMIGTSFPDVRYLGYIDRDKTHLPYGPIEKIAEEESFMAGVKYHGFVDKIREDYVVAKKMYDLLPQSKYITQALKFVEDEILYDSIENWEQYIEYFDDILKEELDFGISLEVTKLWHKILQKTFSSKPTPSGIVEFVSMIGKPKEMATEINDIVSSIKDDERIVTYVRSLYDLFEKELLRSTV